MDNDSPLVLDSSALLCRYLPDRRQPVVDRAMARASVLVVTILARTEVAMALQQVLGPSDRSAAAAAIHHRMADDWDRFWVLPLDARSHQRAAELGGAFGLNLANSLHLASLERLPRPATLLTFDDRQVPAAVALGFDVVDGDEAVSTAHGLLQ